jgi:SAM-dependent methyltransferase
MEIVSCNLCQSSWSKQLFQLSDLLLERDDVQVSLVQCQECGLVYQNPRPSFDEMGQHYPPEYESHAPTLKNSNNSLLLNRALQYGMDKRRRFITRQKNQGRLLDIGCATGHFLRNMGKLGCWELMGVETSVYAAEIARDKYNLDVFAGTVEEANYPDQFFDVITMWDVMEHLHNPLESLYEINRILKEDGTLVFRVPNGNSWDAKLFGSTWAGLDAPRHLYVFTPKTITKMLHLSKFKIIETSCRIGTYPTFVLDIRFWLYKRKMKSEHRQFIVDILYHPISRILSSPIFFLGSMDLKGPLMTITAIKIND